jgi:hypothetical protein
MASVRVSWNSVIMNVVNTADDVFGSAEDIEGVEYDFYVLLMSFPLATSTVWTLRLLKPMDLQVASSYNKLMPAKTFLDFLTTAII